MRSQLFLSKGKSLMSEMWYLQDKMIAGAEAYFQRNNIDYTSPTDNPQLDHAPSLVVIPTTWGKEKAGIAIDAYTDEYDRPVVDIVGYIPAGVTRDINDLNLLLIANQENLDSSGLIFAIESFEEEQRRMTIRAILTSFDDEFPEAQFEEAFNTIRNIIDDYRSQARKRGNFPIHDQREQAKPAELPE